MRGIVGPIVTNLNPKSLKITPEPPCNGVDVTHSLQIQTIMKYNPCLFIPVFVFSKVSPVLSVFRIISILEGLSYLAILSVTLEVLSREFVFQMGMTHGVLIMVYMVGSLIVAHKEDWSLKVWLGVFLASLIPMAFVAVELYLQKSVARGATPEAG